MTPGEALAVVGGGGVFLRLAVPERHATDLAEGDAIEIGAGGEVQIGTLAKLYPQIEGGRVQADVEVDGLDQSFVGRRILVRLPVGERQAILVPDGRADPRGRARLRDRARLRPLDLSQRAVVPGETRHAGRRVVARDPDRPLRRRRGGYPQMSEGHHGPTGALGIAGRLTRAFITSPLTPLHPAGARSPGLVALVTLPREEEPQISVPLVDIHVQAQGLRAEDAVKLVTEPLEVDRQGHQRRRACLFRRPATTPRW